MERQKNLLNLQGNKIDAILTDFDGTLVDTFYANFLAYQKVLNNYNYTLNLDLYKSFYGHNFKDLMKDLKINLNSETLHAIKEQKANIYPSFFHHIQLNHKLLDIIDYLKKLKLKTAIVTTAAKENVLNVIKYFAIESYFDEVITSEDVEIGKPNPNCYFKAAELLNVHIKNCLIFEDSKIGVEAAKNSGSNYIVIR